MGEPLSDEKLAELRKLLGEPDWQPTHSQVLALLDMIDTLRANTEEHMDDEAEQWYEIQELRRLLDAEHQRAAPPHGIGLDGRCDE